MKVTKDLILDSLSQFGVVSRLPEAASFQLSSVRLLSRDSEKLNPEILYLGDSHQLRNQKCSELKSVCVVCIGKTEFFNKFLQKNTANLLCLPEDCELSEVANHLFCTFSRLKKWQHDICMAEVGGQGYQAVLDIGREVFGDNPLLLVNSSYDIIASSLKGTQYNERINNVLQKGYFNKDITDQLSRMGYMEKGERFTKATLSYPPNYMNCAFIVRAYQSGGHMRGFLVLYSVLSGPTKTDCELFSYFSKWVGEYFLLKEHRTKTVSPMEQFMADLLDGTQKDELYLLDRARFLKLPENADYRLCVILWDEFSQSQASYLLMRMRAGLTFPHYKIMIYENSVLLLLRGDCTSQRIMEELDEHFSEFRDLLRTCRAFAGFSTGFGSLFKMNVAYRQACSAAKYGHRLSQAYGVYFYSKYYIYDLLDSYTQKFALQDMYVQKMKLLASSDDHEHSNLELLKNYLLTERSISTTAKLMYMHRNSVIYRISRIQEILGISLDDPDVRLRLILSFKIMELLSGRLDENSLPQPEPSEGIPCIE